MIELDEIGSKAIEIASVITKSINTVGIEATILSIAKKNQIKGKELLDLQKIILQKGKINFTLVKQTGKKQTNHYFVHIDVETKEVEVQAIPVKTKLHLGKLELLGGNDAT